MPAAELVDRHLGPLLGYAQMVTPSGREAAAAVERAFAEVLAGEPAPDRSRELLLRARAAVLAGDVAGAAAGDDDPLRAANFALPVAQRDVLALREVLGLTCDEIATVTGVSPLAAAQLTWRGFGRLRSLMSGEPGGVSLRSRDCERALTLMTLAEDAPLPDEVARGVRRHVATCPLCQVSPVAIADARETYRRAAKPTGVEEARERILAAAPATAATAAAAAAADATP
ncbi:MAG TPA: hypothetical protein VHF89_10110, partial [Solirubrobacteraceae bacterium]|nr:hypothetical protein [Solirubrobacteraceae bacterium]